MAKVRFDSWRTYSQVLEVSLARNLEEQGIIPDSGEAEAARYINPNHPGQIRQIN